MDCCFYSNPLVNKRYVLILQYGGLNIIEYPSIIGRHRVALFICFHVCFLCLDEGIVNTNEQIDKPTGTRDAGCSTYDSVTQRIAQSITPYRITVVQGNFVSAEAAAQMKVGMTRDQVRQLLGTPLLSDMFHADRWDYVFYFKRGNTSVVQQRDFVVNFNGDTVANWTGGEDLPSNLELLAEIDGDKRGKKAFVAAAAAAASGPAAASAAVAATPPAASGTASAQSMDPNAEAAQAANRATDAVQAPSGKITPSVRAGTPTANGGVVPQGATSPGAPQFQFTRPAPPVVPSEQQNNPVGPTAPQSSNGPTYNAPLTAAPATSGTGS